MSRRPPALTLVAVLVLITSALALPLVPAARAQPPPYGSHVFQANPYVVAGAQSYSVYQGSTVAQSFLVNQTYFLTNVTLRVENTGNKLNVLNVSIHPDNPVTHVPDMGTTLASFGEVTPNNASAPVNWSWPFSPAPLLQAGQSYWIVAQNGAPQASNGYEWYSTNGSTYADGEALLGSPSWAGLPVDMFFVTFGQEYDANVTPGMTVDHANAMPNQAVTFTVHVNNTGSQAAPRVWVNDTVPAALTNLSLSFPGIQPVSASTFPNLVFANVANGAHGFTLTAQVAIGTPPGSLVTNRVSLAFTNATNVVAQGGAASSSVRVGLVTKQLYLGATGSAPERLSTTTPTAVAAQTTTLTPGSAPVVFAQVPALAGPLVALNVTAQLYLASQKAPPQTYHLTVSLLDNATAVANLSPAFQITNTGRHAMSFVFPLAGYTFAPGHKVGLQVTNLGGGGGSTDALVIAYNSTSNASHLDIRTDTYVAIQPLSLGNQAGATAIWSTEDSIVVRANVSDPFGLAKIAGVWINVTKPNGQLAASGPMSLVLADSSSLPAWELVSFSLSPPLSTGHYHIVVNAMEDNGVMALADAWADVAVPVFGFAAAASQVRVSTGSPVALFLWYNNTGTGPAGWAWVNDTLPSGLSFVGSNLTVTSVSGSTYTWALTNVSVGAHRLEVDVVVSGTAVTWIMNHASLAAQDMSAHPLATLYANTSLYLNGPVISLTLTSAPAAIIHANETVTTSFTLANTGEQAGQVWLNTTLPQNFTYVSSNAGILGGSASVSGLQVDFTFPSMPANTTWVVTLTALANPALVRNAAYILSAVLADTSTSGTSMPTVARNLTLTDGSPWFPAPGMRFLQGQFPPGSTAPAVIELTNQGNEAAPFVWVNLTVDTRLTLASATANATVTYQAGAGWVAFVLRNVGVGTETLFLNFTINASATDRASLTIVGTLDARDAFGNPLPTGTLPAATVFVFAAQIIITAAPSSPVLEAGSASTLTLYCYNWGTDSAADLWLNLTLPAGLLILNDTFPVLPAISPGTYAWHLTNVVPGPFTAQLRIEPRTTVPNGTATPLLFRYEYTSSNGVKMPGGSLTVNAVTIAPSLDLTVLSSTDHVMPSTDLVYTLRMTNRGMSTAQVASLVDTVDPRLQVLYYNASTGATVQNQTYNWSFSSLLPGETQVVTLTVHVAPGTPANALIPNAFEVTYTNSAGVILGTLRSAAVTVTVEQDLTPYLVGGLAAAAFAGAAVLLVRRRKVDIEEVFLVYRDGVLISHLSRTLMREKDEDVLSGMLTAVQEFVREAFQYGEHRDLHQMDFGDYRILIERGKYVFLAIVYSGRESIAIHKKVRAVIAKIEHDFGSALENWDGDMEEVMGARDVIRETLLGSSNRGHAPKAPAETESE